jgi:hypothetical protein
MPGRGVLETIFGRSGLMSLINVLKGVGKGNVSNVITMGTGSYAVGRALNCALDCYEDPCSY